MPRAVVIGAGIAGLVAARVLAERLDEVVLVERDRLPTSPRDRPGVPQGNHVHVLLRRGYLELQALFPGFDARVAASGAPLIDWSRDTRWITPAGQAPRYRSRLRSRSASRALFEAILRDLTFAQANVRLVQGTDVAGLLGDRHAVHGVRLRARAGRSEPDAATEHEEELEAWLVVDASGRSSRLPAHLASLGLPSPSETVVDASLKYATRTFRIPPRDRDWKALLVRNRPPFGTRGGVIVPVEGDRWIVTIGGAGSDQPPTDEDGFSEFARSLISPTVAEAIREAEPIGAVRGWARTANRRRHVERLTDWPAGLALIGDSLCALNPVYGQGMSVAAMEGAMLGRWLGAAPTRRAAVNGSPPSTETLVRDLARTAALPWLLATGEDSRIAGVVGAAPPGRMTSIVRRYVDEVERLAARDAHTARRFTEVTHLVRPPLALFDPPVAWRVTTAALGRRLRPQPR